MQLLSTPHAAPGDGVDSHAVRKHRGSTARAAFRFLIPVALVAGLGAVATLLVVLPIRFPSTVHTYANVNVANKWVLAKGTDGQLIAHTFNYQTGMSDGYRVSNFSAGSSIYFAVAPTIRPGQRVAAGDTVGTIASSDVQERLVSLQGQLASAERMLAVNATGDKSASIIAAQQRLESAKRRREDYQSTIERTRRLFEDNVLPEGEYDRVMSQAHTLDDAIAIEGADLAAAQSGAKPEAIALIESNIAGLKNEIAVISSRAATFTLRAPIAGIVSSSSGDNLLSISEVSRYVALIPVRSSDYRRVAATHEPAVTITGFSRPVRGRIIAMNHEVEELYGHKVVMATALLDSPPDDLLPGSIARCRIDCTPLAALDYGKFLLHSVASSVEAAGSN
jgi:hypothetical protein